MNRTTPASGHDDFAGDRRPLGECPPGWDPSPHARAIDARIVEMRALLARMQPASDAEALKALRCAFPEASLAVRVAAMTARQDRG